MYVCVYVCVCVCMCVCACVCAHDSMRERRRILGLHMCSHAVKNNIHKNRKHIVYTCVCVCVCARTGGG